MHQLQIEFPDEYMKRFWMDSNFEMTGERARRFIVGKMKSWASSESCKDFESRLGVKYASSIPKLDPNDEIPPITVGYNKTFPITHVYLDGTIFDGSRLQ